MDLRVQRTRNSIVNAFIELRAKKELEKITVKELADLAMINKATFYLHYKDIYDLSDQLENEIISSVLEKVMFVEGLVDDPYKLNYEIFRSFILQGELVNIVFSGNRMGIFVNKLEYEMKDLLYQRYPKWKESDEMNILLSLLIQGSFHSYLNNKNRDMNTLMHTIAKITEHVFSFISTELID